MANENSVHPTPDASTSAQNAAKAHAGIALDFSTLEATSADELSAGHDGPIPWKTGEVGAVRPIDRAVTVVLTDPKPATVAAPKKSTSSCGTSCGCKTAKAPEAPKSSCGTSCGCKTAPLAAAAAVAERSIEVGGKGGGPGAGGKGGGGGGSGKPSLLSKLKAKLNPKRSGSGLPARKIIQALVWVRRVSQTGFFAVFMYFLFQTGFRGNFAAHADEAVRLPLPVEAFLLADPFVGAMTVLSTHTVYRGLLWSLGLLGLTMVFGRVFCGWICPFGTDRKSVV